MRRKKTKEFLTDVELEFMTQLWDLGEGTVRDILSAMPSDRQLAYTSAATFMRILEEKGFVTSEKLGKSLVYAPRVSKDTYQSRTLKSLSEKLFDDTPASLVARLVDDHDLSDEALSDIRALLDRRLNNDPD